MLPLYAGVYRELSPTQIGMLFTISGIIVIAMIVPADFIMDRVGRKWCTAPSTGIPSAGIYFDSGNKQLHTARIVAVAGLAQGLSLGSVRSSTYDIVPPHVRGCLQALRRTVASGSGLAPLFGGYLANTFNPVVPFLFYVPLLAVSAILLAVVGKETLQRA